MKLLLKSFLQHSCASFEVSATNNSTDFAINRLIRSRRIFQKTFSKSSKSIEFGSQSEVGESSRRCENSKIESFEKAFLPPNIRIRFQTSRKGFSISGLVLPSSSISNLISRNIKRARSYSRVGVKNIIFSIRGCA